MGIQYCSVQKFREWKNPSVMTGLGNIPLWNIWEIQVGMILQHQNKSITRDSDMFKKIVATARKIVKDNGFLREKNSESSSLATNESVFEENGSLSKNSETLSAGSESSDSSDSFNLPGCNCTEDSNGLIPGPKCARERFMSSKKCHHQKDQVTVNKTGDFLAFNTTLWHHGYFNHVTELTYFTAQLFCVPSRQPSAAMHWTHS